MARSFLGLKLKFSVMHDDVMMKLHMFIII